MIYAIKGVTILDFDVLPLEIAGRGKPTAESCRQMSRVFRRRNSHEPYYWHRWPLRARRERPRSRSGGFDGVFDR